MYMQKYTALYTSPSNNNSTGKPELTPIEEGLANVKVGLGLAGFLGVSARVGGYICILLLTCLISGSIVGLFTSQRCCSFNPSSEFYDALASSIPRYHFCYIQQLCCSTKLKNEQKLHILYLA